MRAVPELGIFLSSEDHRPSQLAQTAQLAEQSGFRSVMISDHFHPWTDRQGESPFVWSVIGAIAATTKLRVVTGVTCPTFRIHPAIVAQAAATSSLLLDGRFALGVGSGEALNEHILGEHWPPAGVRLEKLEEAVDIMRQLWTGGWVNHHGRHFVVENARIYSCPDTPPSVYVSAFGPRAVGVAARIGDGLVTVTPDSDAAGRYRKEGGTGPLLGTVRVSFDPDESAARKLACDVWRTVAVPGELNQELPMPAHFEQAAELVTEDQVAESIPCGPDPERHAASIRKYLDAGYDEVYVSHVGEDQSEFIRFLASEVQPRLGL